MLATPKLATLAVGPERIFLYNDAAAHHYGARHPAVLGPRLTDAFPHEYGQVAPAYDRVFAGESVHVPAQRLDPAASGSPEVFDAYLTPVRDGGGAVIAAFMTGFAAGDRQRAETRLRESEQRQALLLELSDTLRTITNPAEIRRTSMQLLGERLGLSRIYYFDAERDEDGGWAHVIERGFQRDPDQLEFVGRYSLSDFGDWMVEGFARGEVIAVADTETHAGLMEGERAAYRAVGVAAFINVPLLRNGEYAAGIGAHDIAPRAWTEAEFDLIREVAARTWTATERARVETALRASEARLAGDLAGMRRIHALHGRLAAEPDLDGALRAIVAAAVELAGTDRGCIQLVSADGERLEMFAVHGYDEQSPFIHHFMHEGSELVCQATRRDCRRLEVEDVASFPGLAGTAGRDVALADGVSATNSTPMLSRAGERVGVLSVQFRRPHLASEVENRLLDLLAWTAADFVERHQATARLSASEARFRAMSDNIAQLAWSCDRLGEVDWYNQRWLDYTGRSFEEMRDWGWKIVHHPDHVDRVVAGITRSRDSGEAWEDTFPLCRHDGVYRWFLSRAVPIKNAAGEVVRWFGTNTDITEQRETDAALRDSAGELAHELANTKLLQDISSRLIEGEDDQALYGRLLDAAMAIMRADFASIQRYDTGNKELRLLAHRNFHADSAKFWDRVSVATGTTCGGGLRDNERTFALDASAYDPGGREHYELSGIVSVQSTPLTARDGRLVGMISTHWRQPTTPIESDYRSFDILTRQTADAFERARAEARLRDSEELLRQFGEASQDVLWIRDVDKLQWQYLTPAFETIYGLSREEALSGDNYRSWLDLIVPEDRAHASKMIRRVGDGERVTFEFRIRRPADGAIRWMRNTDFPILNDAGEVELIGGIGHDATELREAESRLQALVEGMPQLVWRAVDGGEWTWASPQWTEYTGQAERESMGWGWMEPVHPDDRQVAREAWSHALDHGGIEVEYRLRGQLDGTYRWFQSRATPVRDDSGMIVEWLGTLTDIHGLRELQERQNILVAELQHRTRNLIGSCARYPIGPATIPRRPMNFTTASLIGWRRFHGSRGCCRTDRPASG